MMRKLSRNRIARDIIGRYEKTLITYQEFDRDIKKIIEQADGYLKGLTYKIKCKKPFTDVEFGIPVGKDPTYQWTHLIDDIHTSECIIKVWLQSVSQSSSDIEEILIAICDNFLKSKFRATPSGLISLKDFEDIKQYAENTITIMQEMNTCIFSVLFCDLDNFKNVNDKLNMDEGDRVIRETGALIEKIISRNAVVLNNGGDEFVLFYPNASHEDAILLAFKLKQEFNNYDFKIKNIPLNLSIGMASKIREKRTVTFLNILGESEKALKKEVKSKTKGLSRFLFKPVEINSNNIKRSLNLAFCLTKSGLLTSQLYNNVWLNALSMLISKKIQNDVHSLSTIKKHICEFIDFVDFNYTNNIIKTCFARNQELDLDPSISALDISLAVSHGIMHWFLSHPDYIKG